MCFVRGAGKGGADFESEMEGWEGCESCEGCEGCGSGGNEGGAEKTRLDLVGMRTGVASDVDRFLPGLDGISKGSNGSNFAVNPFDCRLFDRSLGELRDTDSSHDLLFCLVGASAAARDSLLVSISALLA